EIKPALQKKTAALFGDSGSFFRGVRNGAVGFGSRRRGRTNGTGGLFRDDHTSEVLRGDFQGFVVITGGHRSSLDSWNQADLMDQQGNWNLGGPKGNYDHPCPAD